MDKPKVIQFHVGQFGTIYLLFSDGTMMEGEIEMVMSKVPNGLPSTNINFLREIHVPELPVITT